VCGVGDNWCRDRVAVRNTLHPTHPLSPSRQLVAETESQTEKLEYAVEDLVLYKQDFDDLQQGESHI